MTVMLLATLAAGTMTAVTVGLTVRDLAGRDPRLSRRLGQADREADDAQSLLAPEEGPGWADRAFAALVQQSGSGLETTTALAVVAGAAVVGCAAPLLLFDSLPAGAAGLLIGATAPLAWWSLCRARRLRTMSRQLPEAMDLLADGVRSGRSLQQAAGLVAEELTGALADEFGYCTSQLRLGHTPLAVLNRMVGRIPLAEFRLFAVAIMVHTKTGGNLGLLIERLAAAARDRQQFNGHLGAVTAGSRLSAVGLVAGALVGVSILAYIDPEYMNRFLEHRLGPSLLATAGMLFAIGSLWLWRILRVRY